LWSIGVGITFGNYDSNGGDEDLYENHSLFIPFASKGRGQWVVER
jgi:hypothetical protein